MLFTEPIFSIDSNKSDFIVTAFVKQKTQQFLKTQIKTHYIPDNMLTLCLFQDVL